MTIFNQLPLTMFRPLNASLRALALLLTLGLSVPSYAATTLKIATLSPEGTGWMIELREAAKNIRVRTEDQVKLKIYPGGVMGDDKAVLRKLRIGQLHGAAMTSGGVMQPYPDIALYNLPLVFRDSAEVDFVRSRLDKKLMSGLRKKKFVGFGLAEVGFAYPMTKQPVTAVADFQNRRVWAPDNDPGALKAYSSFNITPTPLPIADVLTGLQTGLIDSIGSPPIGAIALQWHTQVDYALELPLMYVYGLFAITERAFNRMSEAEQAIVTEELTAAVSRVDSVSRRDNEAAGEALVGEGLQWLQPSATELDEWYAIADQANQKLKQNDYVSPEMFDELMSLLEEYRSGQTAAQ
ncbi:MAG TPA: C4-dicarboxylate ABC transporter [Gammaproteobacteria bacterium]|jgi:TRAP-type C4-dicarboxylate transport system substrate-binding protein|nr:C4-dicarboxylate ABC transporter [Gammaproteobacteria bacterium]HCG69352.1 C4-dicarboxylate ABC transporter [Gammaproteobacteria bacterium]